MIDYGIRLVLFVAVVNFWVFTPSFGANLIVSQSKTSPSVGSAPEKKLELVNLWQPGDAGQRMYIRGRVTNIDGTPIVGASIYIRQTDGNGEYHAERYQANLKTDEKGGYRFASVLPGQYYGVKHVHVWVTHDGYGPLDTRTLFKGDPNLDESTAPEAIFLEEGKIKGETMLFGRFDIVMRPM